MTGSEAVIKAIRDAIVGYDATANLDWVTDTTPIEITSVSDSGWEFEIQGTSFTNEGYMSVDGEMTIFPGN
jgi:hypothetical protein